MNRRSSGLSLSRALVDFVNTKAAEGLNPRTFYSAVASDTACDPCNLPSSKMSSRTLHYIYAGLVLLFYVRVRDELGAAPEQRRLGLTHAAAPS